MAGVECERDGGEEGGGGGRSVGGEDGGGGEHQRDRRRTGGVEHGDGGDGPAWVTSPPRRHPKSRGLPGPPGRHPESCSMEVRRGGGYALLLEGAGS